MLRHLINKLRERPYFILFFLFIVWMAFFDSEDLVTQYKLARHIEKLHKEKSYYLQEIEKIKQAREALLYDLTFLEKLAREKYLMKKPTEDLYILSTESPSDNN